MATLEQARAEKRLAEKAARRRLDDRELEREIFRASRQWGLTQRRISEILVDTSQATVQRTLRRFEDNPALLHQTPAEIIDRRAAGLISDTEMMDQLSNWTYSFGYTPSAGGAATDAYVSGDWDEVELAFYRGLVSDDEYTRLTERQKEHLERAARTR